MSLNDIQLAPITITELYKYSLIESTSEQYAVPGSSGLQLITLGNNNRGVAIVVASDDNLYLPDNELNFLLGILAACQLTMNDVAILNINKNGQVTYQVLSKELAATTVLLFGVSAASIALPIDFPHYQVQQYNHQTYLTAPGLSAFQDNKEEKTRLWNSLKLIFSI